MFQVAAHLHWLLALFPSKPILPSRTKSNGWSRMEFDVIEEPPRNRYVGFSAKGGQLFAPHR